MRVKKKKCCCQKKADKTKLKLNKHIKRRGKKA